MCCRAWQELRAKGAEVWKISKVQFVYNTSESTHFINAYNRESDYSSVTQQLCVPLAARIIHIELILTV